MALNKLDQHRAVLLQLQCAAFLLGGTALFSKLIPLPAVDIIAYRAFICGCVVGMIGMAIKHSFRFDSLFKSCLVILCSVLFAVHWSTYFHAMQVSSVAIGIVSMFTFPVLTVFIEPLFNKKRIRAYDVLMGLLVLLGVYLMVPELSISNHITQGVMFGLLSACAVAIRNVLVTRFLKGTSSLVLMTYHGIISAICLLPFVAVTPSELSLYDWVLIALLATLFTAVPHTQITYGLLRWPAKKVSMIISLQVLYASLFAWLLLDEALSTESALGGLFILIAAMGESLKREATSESHDLHRSQK